MPNLLASQQKNPLQEHQLLKRIGNLFNECFGAQSRSLYSLLSNYYEDSSEINAGMSKKADFSILVDVCLF